MNQTSFDQLPIQFRFLIRLLAFSTCALGAFRLSVGGWHHELHFLVCAALCAFSLYFLAGSLILFSSIAAQYGGRWMGYCFAFVRRHARRLSARAV